VVRGYLNGTVRADWQRREQQQLQKQERGEHQMIRYAKVYGTGITQKIVQAYLPTGYAVTGTHEDGAVVICGTDYRGWTLDDYVIPRLASGGYTAHEATQDDLDETGAVCYRCREVIEPFSISGDIDDAWKDSSGSVACANFHGHDEHGIYSPMHNPVDDNDSTVVPDTEDHCVEKLISQQEA
jgi:hypothetical protein